MFSKTLVLVPIFGILQVYANLRRDVSFFLYTPTNYKVPVEIYLDRPDLVDIINPSKQVKFLCHGYKNSYKSHWIEPTKTAYMRTGEENIIAVDWSKNATGLYSHAIGSLKSVAEQIADFIVLLHYEKKIPLTNFHLIGHSLGAHIFGYTGQWVLAKTGSKIGRITGLDPAGPSFNNKECNKRLSPDDAIFVDAIHTDAELLGFKESLAHADFWPNGGMSQPGCTYKISCSHSRSAIYFYESINYEHPLAWNCNSYDDFKEGKCFSNKKVLMGNSCPPNASGNFYLVTRKKYPFDTSIAKEYMVTVRRVLVFIITYV